MLYIPDGVKPSPDKVRAIENLEPPKDKKELHIILGMVTYMSSFIPNLADHTAPLRNLLKENVDFAWNPSHSKAFEKVKLLICTATTLAYYDTKKPVALHVDASSKGLGAALFQDNKPIAFASKALTPAKTRYANIERELLAVVYGCEKFHSYLYGRSFFTESGPYFQELLFGPNKLPGHSRNGSLDAKGRRCTGGKEAFFVNAEGEKEDPVVIGTSVSPRCFKNFKVSHQASHTTAPISAIVKLG